MKTNEAQKKSARTPRGRVALAVGLVSVGAGADMVAEHFGRSIVDAVRDREVAAEYADPHAYDRLVESGLIDPRNQKIYKDMMAGKSDGKPFKMALTDGTVVTIGVVGYGATANGIAHQLAPGDDDLTNITRVVAAQTSPSGIPVEMQPGAVFLVPDSLVQNKPSDLPQ